MAARAKLQAVDRAKYHPVSIAIDRAQAAAWLLGELRHGHLAGQLGVGPVPIYVDPSVPLPPDEIHYWLTDMAADVLRDSLVEAQEELRKSQAVPKGEGGA